MGSRANSSDGWPHVPRKLAHPRLCYRPRQDGNVGSDGRVDATQQPSNAKKSADMAEICGLGIASNCSERQHPKPARTAAPWRMRMADKVIGIDLGTTNSVVAVME